MDEILKRLEKIEKLIESQNLVRKDVLNFNECCDYLELSQSHLYKLTSTGANHAPGVLLYTTNDWP